MCFICRPPGQRTLSDDFVINFKQNLLVFYSRNGQMTDIPSVYSAPHGIIDGRARENRSAARSSIEEIRFARSPSFLYPPRA